MTVKGLSSSQLPTSPAKMVTLVMTNNSVSEGSMVSFDNLYSAILQCFVVIISGYIAGRTGHVTATQGRGIATFVSTFCLPALLFRAMCTLNFSQVNWYFVLANLIAKTSVFLVVVVLTLLVKRPVNLGCAGLFAIFTTQSNDIALGFPIVQALYKDSHPEYLTYIYLLAPISLLLLNPIGFALMELQRHFSQHASGPAGEGQEESSSRQHRKDSTPGSHLSHSHADCRDEERKWWQVVGQVIRGVLLNPIVFMSAVGIAGNFIFQHNIPETLDNILSVLGEAFSACALFYLGVSMVGKVQNQIGMGLVVPVLLIFAKSLMLPLVTWEVVSWLQPNETASKSLSMYGFLYGTFPTAPSVVLYAAQYGMDQDTVATGMVAGTFLSAPLMFVSAKMMTVVVNHGMDYHSLLLNTSFDASIVGVVCCVWVLTSLILSGRWRQVPHRFTICLVLSQLVACIGMVAYREDGSHRGWRHYAQFVTLLVGVFASRCWTASLALAMCLLHIRSLCFVLKSQVWFHFLGFGFPVLMTGLLFMVGAQHISDQIDPSFHYGFMQTMFSTVVLLMSLLITMVSMVVWLRNMRHPPADSHFSHISSSATECGNSSQSCIGGLAHDGDVQEDHLSQSSSQRQQSPCQHQLPCQQPKNYQTCGASHQCASASIEDIIPFPATVDDSKSVSDGSCCEDHGLMESGVLPIDERTCLLGQCTSEERSACRPLLRRYAAEQENRMDSPQEEDLQNAAEALRQEYQSTHHLLLLLLLTVSMLIGLFLCLWKIFSNQLNGIYVEIEFLDSVFNYGQAFLVFIVFGFDLRLVFSPMMRRCVSKHKWFYLMYVRIRRWLYGAELVRLPNPRELDEGTQTTCRQFLHFHIHTCRTQISRDARFRLRKYQNVFTGAELCDWLIGAGLAANKGEAVAYGRRLLLGRVIAHVTGVHHFQHSPFFYTFVNNDDANC